CCQRWFGRPKEWGEPVRRRVRAELGLAIAVGIPRTKHLAKIASHVAKPDGLVLVEPKAELAFLPRLPVELMWGVGPVITARLADVCGHSIVHLAALPRGHLEALGGRAVTPIVTALAHDTRPRQIRTHR